MLPTSLQYVKNLKPRQLLEIQRHYSGLQRGMRITMSDSGGVNISTGGSPLNSSITNRVGSNKKGTFVRNTSSLRGLGGAFNQVERRTKFSSEPNNPQNVSRNLGTRSSRIPTIRHSRTSLFRGGRRSKSDTANMMHDVAKKISNKTPNFIKRIVSKGFNMI